MTWECAPFVRNIGEKIIKQLDMVKLRLASISQIEKEKRRWNLYVTQSVQPARRRRNGWTRIRLNTRSATLWMTLQHKRSLRNGMRRVDFRSRDSSIRAACCIRRWNWRTSFRTWARMSSCNFLRQMACWWRDRLSLLKVSCWLDLKKKSGQRRCCSRNVPVEKKWKKLM